MSCKRRIERYSFAKDGSELPRSTKCDAGRYCTFHRRFRKTILCVWRGASSGTNERIQLGENDTTNGIDIGYLNMNSLNTFDPAESMRLSVEETGKDDLQDYTIKVNPIKNTNNTQLQHVVVGEIPTSGA